MTLCLVSPRFFPVIGGTETYLLNIAKYCSSYIKTIAITSNLKNFPLSLFEKYIFIEKRYDLISKNFEIIRVNPSDNIILRSLFFLNQFFNKNIEILFDKLVNPHLYSQKKIRINQKLINSFSNKLIYQRFFFRPNFSKIYYMLKKINRIEKINIIHSSPIRFSSDICAYLFCRKNNIPYICTPLYHINPYADSIFYPSFQHILKNADAVIAVTNLEKKFYTKFGIKDKRVYIIPPGIDLDSYKKPNIKEFKNKFDIPDNAPLLLFMGRRNYEKGIFHCIYALKYLIRRFKDIKLMIAGPTTREYLHNIEKIPSKLKNHIIDLGLIDGNTKTDALASCNVFILPSLDDAFGIVYLEAWVFKKPVIGVLGGNVEGLIDNNINGVLVPFKNIKKLALKIENLLKNDKIREELGQNGYEKLNNNYLLEITNKKMLKLYQKFI